MLRQQVRQMKNNIFGIFRKSQKLLNFMLECTNFVLESNWPWFAPADPTRQRSQPTLTRPFELNDEQSIRGARPVDVRVST